MNQFTPTLFEYLKQAQSDNLKTSTYTKEYSDLKVRVSFGMGGRWDLNPQPLVPQTSALTN